MEPTNPIELKEPIENAEAYDKCMLKLLLPLLGELMEELSNECTLIDDPVDTEEDKSLLLPSPDELIELTNLGNKVENNVEDKVGDKVGNNVGDATVGTEEQRPHVRRQKELSNSKRQKPWTFLTSARHSASPNSSTHDDEAGFAVGTTFGAAVGMVDGAAVGRLEEVIVGSGLVCATNAIVK
jgi:hypothetical protein